jgi:hypothetical protein
MGMLDEQVVRAVNVALELQEMTVQRDDALLARTAWKETAAQHCRNEDYYRGLLDEIGNILGPEAFVSEDGSVQEDVVRAKLPELVRRRLSA